MNNELIERLRVAVEQCVTEIAEHLNYEGIEKDDISLMTDIILAAMLPVVKQLETDLAAARERIEELLQRCDASEDTMIGKDKDAATWMQKYDPHCNQDSNYGLLNMHDAFAAGMLAGEASLETELAECKKQLAHKPTDHHCQCEAEIGRLRKALEYADQALADKVQNGQEATEQEVSE